MSRLARPRTYSPKGTALGLWGFLVTSTAIPSTLANVATPYLPRGVDWAGWATLAGGGFAMLLFLPLIAALYSRKYWGICYFFWIGCALLALYLSVALAALVCKFGPVPPGDPSKAFDSTFGLVELFVVLPAPCCSRAH